MFPEIPEAIAYDRWLQDKGEEFRLDYDINPGDVIFDIGAHVGDWARDILARYDCEIHLFEPMPEFAREASEKYRDNPNVHVHNYALLDYNGTADLALFGTGSSLYSHSSDSIKVEVRDIGEVLAELGVSRIRLAKINIEGAEFDLLEYLLKSGLMTAFDELQIQFHNVFPDAVDRRLRIQKALSETFDPTYNYAFIWENWARRTPVIAGYELINNAVARQNISNGWENREVVKTQHEAFLQLVDAHKNGQSRIDLSVLVESVNHSALDSFQLLEVGCASGYMYEVLKAGCSGLSNYVGLDSSLAMAEYGRACYPDVEFLTGNSCSLPFLDDSFDIVLNGVSLMHTKDYPRAVAEAARVASTYCVFHTVPVHEGQSTCVLRKMAYGQPVIEYNFNEAELLTLFETVGLKLIKTWDSLEYSVAEVVGEPTTTKTYLCEVDKAPVASSSPAQLVNIGCGKHTAPGWLNYDIAPQAENVIQHDITKPLPLEPASCDFVYHSHVLEHLPRHGAPKFLRECLRVLKPGGVLRVAIPDLEAICRLYLENLAQGIEGNQAAIDRHRWLQVELLDQMAREESGGEMLRYWQQVPIPEKNFMWQRIGEEARPMVENIQQAVVSEELTPGENPFFAARSRPDAAQAGAFHFSGEKHLWMYDRLSLQLLLEECGFVGCHVREAGESASVFFPQELELMPTGVVRKPDSLFMEAFCPSQ